MLNLNIFDDGLLPRGRSLIHLLPSLQNIPKCEMDLNKSIAPEMVQLKANGLFYFET